MKTMKRFSSLVAAAGLLAGGGVWMACSDNKSGNDGGADGGGDSPGNPDSPGMDGNMQGDSGGDGGGDGAIQLNCASYCKNIVTICASTQNAQYLDEATCVKMCANFPAGMAGDTTGNTLGCRVYHLNVASTSSGNATLHCPHAGPYGFGTCGSNCEDFCLLYGAECNSSTYGGAGCTVGCATLANDGGPFINAGGNTLPCREYHLENAYKFGDMNGMGHCAHAGNSGGGVCQ